MQTKINFRSVIATVAILVAIVFVSSCTGTKKYGCPNHMFTPTLVQ